MLAVYSVKYAAAAKEMHLFTSDHRVYFHPLKKRMLLSMNQILEVTKLPP